ncbi:MAG: ATP-dependent DNA helicase RecG [Methylophilaceae bacterium]
MNTLSNLHGVTKPLLAKLKKLGISVPFDLLLHLPLRYVDETRITAVRDLRLGESAQVEGEIIHAETQYRPRKALICQLQDASDVLYLRFLNFYPSQVAQLKAGSRIRAFGEPRYGFFGMEMVHPQCKKVGEETPLKQALTPIYPTTASLSQITLRKLVGQVLVDSVLDDTLPLEALQALGLPDFASTMLALHQPTPEVSLEALENREHPAWRRLAFDELLAQQLSMRRHYARRHEQKAPAMPLKGDLTQRLLKALPFVLTGAQQKVHAEISRDLSQPHPMQRLLQGDVGSGKTIIAALAACQAIENGKQVALMAPTEILAEQHYRKLAGWLEPLGVRVAWLTGSLPKAAREAAIQACADGTAQLAIGTHALFQDKVAFADLALAIVDEQHRFGVHQRMALRQKGLETHQLMMSATPIPRTLSMSYYADLDVSVIDELPPGRTPVTTKLVADTRRDEVIGGVRHACLQGQQVYWVCPLIEESEVLDLQTAIDTFEHLTKILPEIKVDLVHGRLKPAEKQAVMQQFVVGNIQLLVATTVIEVGVDVPNASLMVIEHAERFGLSQLHQLRGRVGRGATQSACILLYQNPLSQMARERLKIIFENTDGFEIARADLHLRGPGEFLGVRQSGVPMLKIADLERDVDLLEAARSWADKLLKTQPDVAEKHLQRWLGQAEEYVKV